MEALAFGPFWTLLRRLSFLRSLSRFEVLELFPSRLVDDPGLFFLQPPGIVVNGDTAEVLDGSVADSPHADVPEFFRSHAVVESKSGRRARVFLRVRVCIAHSVVGHRRRIVRSALSRPMTVCARRSHARSRRPFWARNMARIQASPSGASGHGTRDARSSSRRPRSLRRRSKAISPLTGP